MSVYVDPLAQNGWHLGRNCHMWADSLPELHAMADAIGMKRGWFQQKSYTNGLGLPHYDLTESRRRKAISLGVIELTRRDSAAMWARMGFEPHATIAKRRLDASRDEDTIGQTRSQVP